MTCPLHFIGRPLPFLGCPRPVHCPALALSTAQPPAILISLGRAGDDNAGHQQPGPPPPVPQATRTSAMSRAICVLSIPSMRTNSSAAGLPQVPSLHSLAGGAPAAALDLPGGHAGCQRDLGLVRGQPARPDRGVGGRGVADGAAVDGSGEGECIMPHAVKVVCPPGEWPYSPRIVVQ